MSAFIKIYLWQILSLISGFATLFIVTPFLATNAYLFGVYSIVTSLSLFLTYADVGFLSAGVKYASECVAREERDEEIKIIAFVTFVLTIFVSIIAIITVVFACYPHVLIKSLSDKFSEHIASVLLLVFALSTPVLILQRSVQIIFNIRLKDYLYQRIFTTANLVKISSAYFFFGNGKYMLIEYFIFTQIIGLIAVIITLYLARKIFNYDLTKYFKSIKFSRTIYNKTRKLAFSSLFVTVSWIIFYEIDLIVIGKFIGPKAIALFSLCLSVTVLFRSLHSIFYNPFIAKFNHYIGKKDFKSFSEAFYKILVLGLPISVFPTLIVVLTIKSFVFSWVGPSYSSMIPIVSVLLIIYIFNFISNPASIAIVAFEKIKSIYIISAIMPIIYWVGIVFSYRYFGLQSFAIFKLLAIIISTVVYSFLAVKLLKIDYQKFLISNIIPVMFVSIILYLLIHYTQEFLPYSKGSFELFKYTLACACYLLFAIVLYFLFSNEFREIIKSFMMNLINMLKAKKG
ncbi:lipopolysaccharide biosynthesis protein [Flavobacterium sp. N1736]|uniref:lipopolysaccharide biosynthesis protein n=1 Tax=Flavobacterium sp. N1736 TaxID=2986823 RepID=UPI0022253F85|nr:hypothetical protein [Flavobacterium sp. N1736]